MNLPIEVVEGTSPPVFKWNHVVDLPGGKHVIEHRESLPPELERAVERMVTITRQVMMDNSQLRGEIESLQVQRSELVDRVEEQQAELRKQHEQIQSHPATSTTPRRGR